jgi:hypothetical protein
LLARGGAGGFDFFEVAVRVAFDGGFAVEHLLVGGGVFAALFFVGGHCGCGVYGIYVYSGVLFGVEWKESGTMLTNMSLQVCGTMVTFDEPRLSG